MLHSGEEERKETEALPDDQGRGHDRAILALARDDAAAAATPAAAPSPPTDSRTSSQ